MKILSLSSIHIDSVVEVEEACFAHPWNREGIESNFNNPDAYFFVALDDADKVIGYIGTYMVRDECFVTNVAVLPSCRKQGVGSALVKQAVSSAQANGASFITLEVRLSNVEAINIYKKFGFESDGVRPKFYRDPDEDALIMTKRF
ncbi:MAG: ribosomal protein S18-alanine N-acetyltransferase [Oscillospiraceae bacterium]|nr:ribosomal protein S18-alanine N-acetyltransferase [Candidatus Limimonas egerieequi]